MSNDPTHKPPLLDYARHERRADPAARALWCAFGFLAGSFIAVFFGIDRLHHTVYWFMFLPMFVFGGATVVFFVQALRERKARGRIVPYTPMWPVILMMLLALPVSTLITADAIFGEDPHLWSARCRACSQNLGAIGQLLMHYAARHGNAYPDTLGALALDQDTVTGLPDLFVCPATDHRPSGATSPQALAADLDAGKHVSYVYVARGLTLAAHAEMVLMYEPPANHRGTINVLYGDGHVEMLNPNQVPAFIAELQSGHNPPRAQMLK